MICLKLETLPSVRIAATQTHADDSSHAHLCPVTKRCQFWCQLGFLFASPACTVVRGSNPRNRSKYRRFSLCCVSLRIAAKCLAGILSPQRLPFRHPGDWHYKFNEQK